ncbi:uncharacterized protein RHO17_014265 [Thomomys bottae]
MDPKVFTSQNKVGTRWEQVSWEIKLSDLEEKIVDEFSSSGFKCPTCFAVKGRECDSELRWCAADKIKCVEFSGIINTVTNESTICKSAIRNRARVRHPASIFIVLFLEKLFF